MNKTRRVLASTAGLAALAALGANAAQAGTLAATGSSAGKSPVHTVSAAERGTAATMDIKDIIKVAKPMTMPKNVPSPAGSDRSSRGAEVKIAPSAAAGSTKGISAKEAVARYDTNAGALWPLGPTANPNRQVGKLYFDTDPGPAYSWSWCTATAVNAENKSTLITAGHCVWDATNRRWYTNLQFYPGYQYGATQGVYYAKTYSTTWNYYNYGTSADDMGAVVVYPRNGVAIVNALGGHGAWFNRSTNQFRTSLGYPITDWRWPGYTANGEDARYCQGTDYYYGSGTFAGQNYLNCRMTGGASGGPWLTWVNGSWMGYVNSVNSNKGGIGAAWANVMFGPYFDNKELQVFNTVRNL